MKQHRDRSDNQDDATLIASVLAGEREAFDILLSRYSPSVLRLCTALLGNTFEAQDIAQEASLQAFLGLARLQEPARFAAWFHAIAANLARSALRRRREQSLYTLSDDVTLQVFWIDAPPTLEEYQMLREIHATILLALGDLSEVNRQAVIGFYLQGYSYEELAQLLSVPISTVKGRLFQGRKLLKTLLRPLAETHLQPISKQRKEQSMTTDDLVELQLDSLRTLLLTREHLVILRDPQTERGLPIRLTASEVDALDVALRARRDANELPFPQDLSQRLLESFGAQLQRVVINALAGQTLYATLTIRQGAQTHEVDMRLSEAIALAVRMDASLFITRSLLATAATLDLTTQPSTFSWEELEARGKDMRTLGREERLQLEEAMRRAMAAYRHNRPEEFLERLWAFLLESLTGARDDISAAELRALDVATAFPTREVTWDEQPMVAIRLPDQRETAWMLVRPSIWERIMKGLQHLREPDEKRAPLAAPPFPDVLPPQMQQRVEESLARLVELPEMRTALLLNAQGTLSAWKGPDTQDTLQRFSSRLFRDISGHPPLANKRELDLQLGPQPQKATTAYGDKKAVLQELPRKIWRCDGRSSPSQRLAARRHLRRQTCSRPLGGNAPGHPSDEAGSVRDPHAMTIELSELSQLGPHTAIVARKLSIPVVVGCGKMIKH
jgi:RNA polymerase sigma-70 factor, ECF subfamily